MSSHRDKPSWNAGHRKLTPAEVEAIQRDRAFLKLREISAKYGISMNTIWKICNDEYFHKDYAA